MDILQRVSKLESENAKLISTAALAVNEKREAERERDFLQLKYNDVKTTCLSLKVELERVRAQTVRRGLYRNPNDHRFVNDILTSPFP